MVWFWKSHGQPEGAAKTIGFPIETYIGFDEEYSDTWDCYVNHYYDFSWATLVDYDVAQYYEALGYTEGYWSGTDTEAPLTELLHWEELSDTERDAADMICYFQQTWDMQDTIDLWPDELKGYSQVTQRPTNAPSSVPTRQFSSPPTLAPTSSHTASPTTFPTITPTTSPTLTPSSSPTLRIGNSETLAPTSTEPTPTTSASGLLVYPGYRYTPFIELNNDNQAAAYDLGYNDASWDLPGTNDFEWYGFESLTVNQREQQRL